MGIFISRDDVKQELEQVKGEFEARVAQMESTLLAEIQRYQSIGQSVKEAVEQHSHTVPAVPQINQLRNRIDYFADQHTELSNNLAVLTRQVETLTQTVTQFTPTSPNGEMKPIHEVISTYTQRISAEINNMLIAHSNWLKEHTRKLDEAGETARTLVGQLSQSRLHITPKSEEPGDDTELTA